MIPVGPVVARCQTSQARTVLWAYLSDPGLRGEWWPELNLEARIGGAVREQWSEGDASRDATGEVDVFVDGHALGFRWTEAGDPRPTAVLVTLRSTGSGASLTVTETGFDMLPEPSARAAASQEGWDVLLRDLAAAVEDLEDPEAIAAVGAAASLAAAGDATAVDAAAGDAAAGDAAAPADEAADEADADAEDSEAEDAVAEDAVADDADVVEGSEGFDAADAERSEAAVGDDDEIVDAEIVDAEIVDAEEVDEAVIEGATGAGSSELTLVEPQKPVEYEEPVDSESAAWAASGVSITVGDGYSGADEHDDDDGDASSDFDRLLRGR